MHATVLKNDHDPTSLLVAIAALLTTKLLIARSLLIWTTWNVVVATKKATLQRIAPLLRNLSRHAVSVVQRITFLATATRNRTWISSPATTATKLDTTAAIAPSLEIGLVSSAPTVARWVTLSEDAHSQLQMRLRTMKEPQEEKWHRLKLLAAGILAREVRATLAGRQSSVLRFGYYRQSVVNERLVFSFPKVTVERFFIDFFLISVSFD